MERDRKRERERRREEDRERERERFTLRDWLPQLWRLAESKICRVGRQLGTQGRVVI